MLNWNLERDLGRDPDRTIYHNKTILGLLGISAFPFQTMQFNAPNTSFKRDTTLRDEAV